VHKPRRRRVLGQRQVRSRLVVIRHERSGECEAHLRRPVSGTCGAGPPTRRPPPITAIGATRAYQVRRSESCV
jgi:hypothetical protein